MAAWVVACVIAVGACSAATSAVREPSGAPANTASAPAGPDRTVTPRGPTTPEPAPTEAGSSPGRAVEGPTVAFAECVAQLPLRVRIGQTMLVLTTDTDRVSGWIDEGLVAGVIPSGEVNRGQAGRLKRVTSGTKYGALLAVDEEGGAVQRFRKVIGAIPSAREQALTMKARDVRALYADHGAALREWGVDMVMAPVVDVGFGPGIGSRAYSDDHRVVVKYAGAAARGYADAGLLPVLKHFPGHGGADGDTHDTRAVGPPIDQLRKADLVPFAEIAREVEVGVMVGHTTIPGYAGRPSSQSTRAITGLLIREQGFAGLVISDALNMAAVGTRTEGEALVGFLRAGGHLGIVGPEGSVQGRRAVRRALADGSLTEERLNAAATTVLSAKGVQPCG